MTEAKNVRISSCNFRRTWVCVDLKKPEMIGKTKEGKEQLCKYNPLEETINLEVEQLNKTTKTNNGLQATVVVSCPAEECPHYKRETIKAIS